MATFSQGSAQSQHEEQPETGATLVSVLPRTPAEFTRSISTSRSIARPPSIAPVPPPLLGVPVPFLPTSNTVSLSSTFIDILRTAVEICESQTGGLISTYSFAGELEQCDALDDLIHIFWTYTEPLVTLSRNRDRSFIGRMVILLHFFLPNSMLISMNFWCECRFLYCLQPGMYLLYFLQSTCDDSA